MGSFGDLAKLGKELGKQAHQGVLTGRLDLYLSNIKESSRAAGYHPSELYGLCIRRMIFSKLLPVGGGSIEPQLRRIFDNGTALHSWYQNRYLGPMRVLYGSWKCKLCGKTTEGFMPAMPCDKCGGNGWRYVETGVKHEELGIIGHYDGELRINDKRYLLEMKTTSAFDRLSKKPSDAHIYQTQIYMWLSGIPFGLILYIDKFRSRLKEHVFPFDPTIEDDVRKNIGLVEKAWKKRILPAKECFTETAGKKRYCPFIETCFDPEIDKIINKVYLKFS